MSHDLAAALRNAVRRQRLSISVIARQAGIPQSTLAEFMAGADMRLANASKLARFLALELRPRRR